ncbi:MAG: glycosyltransferase family 2 protein [Verrucomicrobia bacterium]|nr:glycosyltransferase family 2 protein [Verrucomicrobiota bacterium]
MKPEAESLVAVIAAYKEVGLIGNVVRRALPLVSRVIVVYDGSADGTGDEARAAGAEVIVHPANRGKGAALMTGFARCRGLGCEWIVLLDADGQHDPADIPGLLAARASGTKLIVGNRMGNAAGMPWARWLGNRVSSWLLSRLIGQRVPDSQCGYRLVHRSLLDVFQFSTQHYECDSEMLILAALAGHRIGSVPVTTLYGRETSYIKPWKDLARFFRLLWRYRGRRQ